MQEVRESFHTACMLWDGAFGFEYEFDSSSSRRLYLPKGVKMIQKWELYEQGGMRKKCFCLLQWFKCSSHCSNELLVVWSMLAHRSFFKEKLKWSFCVISLHVILQDLLLCFWGRFGFCFTRPPFFPCCLPFFFLAVCLHLWFTSSADLL